MTNGKKLKKAGITIIRKLTTLECNSIASNISEKLYTFPSISISLSVPIKRNCSELYKGINCFTIDPRFILEKGLYSYGDNNIGCISAPPKHFDTALNLLEQAVGLSSTYIAGGVSIGIFAEALAPYIVDMDDKSVRQALQSFVFTMNQAFKNRGSQSVFSSINLDLAMPKFL